MNIPPRHPSFLPAHEIETNKMSSAALQTAPHQPTSVGSHSPVAATSNRPYTAGSSQSREPYYNQSPANASSPASTRRPSRRPSGNGASNNQSSQYNSPVMGNSPPVNSRGSSNTASPATASPNAFPSMAPGDPSRGIPPVVSTRTSSSRTNSAAFANNAAVSAASAAERSSRRREHGDERTTNSPREVRRESNAVQTNGIDGDKGKEEALAAAAAASRSRRRGQESKEALPHRPSGNREQRNAQPPSAIPARMTSTGNSSPSGPSRQSSEVLSRVVVSKPEVDLDRERERMAEAVPSSPTSPATQTSPMGKLSVVPADGVDDSARVHRSRHDHSKKEKSSSRFGEYFLGATLGEGEFGKVKMGWKQEGGVQVG